MYCEHSEPWAEANCASLQGRPTLPYFRGLVSVLLKTNQGQFLIDALLRFNPVLFCSNTEASHFIFHMISTHRRPRNVLPTNIPLGKVTDINGFLNVQLGSRSFFNDPFLNWIGTDPVRRFSHDGIGRQLIPLYIWGNELNWIKA